MRTCTRCGNTLPDEPELWARRSSIKNTGNCRPCASKQHRDKRERQRQIQLDKLMRQRNRIVKPAIVRHPPECRLCLHLCECKHLLAVNLPLMCENTTTDDLYRLRLYYPPTPAYLSDMGDLAPFVMEILVMEAV